MRNLLRASASIAALSVLFSVRGASAADCEKTGVDWSKFPTASECVGGVRGFTEAEWKVTIPGAGDYATKDGCAPQGACAYWVHDLLPASEFERIPWGSKPAQTYDIAVFGPVPGDAWGHIAMIDHVSGDTLWLMDDNWGKRGEKSCRWEAGHDGWPHETTWKPYGVYRYKKVVIPHAWEAQVVERSWPAYTDAPIELALGETQTGWIKLKNIGTDAWPAGIVKLAPIPRDKASGLEAATWLSSTRVSSVASEVKPGETAQFEWDITGSALGHFEPYFGVVADGKEWFADSGGPSDSSIRLNIDVTEAGGAGGGGGAAGAGGHSGGSGEAGAAGAKAGASGHAGEAGKSGAGGESESGGASGHDGASGNGGAGGVVSGGHSSAGAAGVGVGGATLGGASGSGGTGAPLDVGDEGTTDGESGGCVVAGPSRASASFAGWALGLALLWRLRRKRSSRE